MTPSLHRLLHGRDLLAKLPALLVLMLVSIALWLSVVMAVRALVS
jgi:hypothetical protein